MSDPFQSQGCRMTQEDLHSIFVESRYGENKGLFEAYFEPNSSPPRCCVCSGALGTHNSRRSHQTTTTLPGATTDSSFNNTNSAAPVTGTVAEAAVEAEPQPFVIPSIPEHDNPSVLQNVPPPLHWFGWRYGLAEIGEANAEGIKLRCRVPITTPEGEVRPCGALVKHTLSSDTINNLDQHQACPDQVDPVENQEHGRHLALQHQLEKAPAPFEIGHGRDWKAPCCPCCDDCGTLCDCLCCPCCFCDRLEEALVVKDKLNVTYYIATARTPGEPVGCNCKGCCSHCGSYSCGCTMFWIMTLFGLMPCYTPICDLQFHHHHRFRAHMLKRENIQENGCTRRCVSFCCMPCDLVQVHRELRISGIDPGTTCCRSNPALVGMVPSPPTAAQVFDANPLATRARVNEMY